MDQDEILMDAEERMDKAVDHLKSSLTGIRTGRANPGLVDSIKVEYYGSPTPLKQIANVSVPEPQQIMIRPFDVSSLGEIAKAIQNSDLGMAPNNDGRVVRLNVPALSTERRQQMVGRVKELAEEARISIRNIRRDGNKHADQAEKDKSMSEDDRDTTKDMVQDLTKRYEGLVNTSAEKKEKEVMDE
ncbi:MAG: ribosome recycling factor [Fuerstiella sp.]